ncbi:hypothetical protein K466DRAFT_285356 [Polyporus arcularius HHB13444]|uniref:Uncharacterized protein n=1 Tax=Polyporus arcularius HHB13444 TaxID=1314778 RepID=A0A5C3P1D8_9APHY|nr:hypothetical protein K466DRAFT_285356 [Polyporus arcularius HHB13444]
MCEGCPSAGSRHDDGGLSSDADPCVPLPGGVVACARTVRTLAGSCACAAWQHRCPSMGPARTALDRPVTHPAVQNIRCSEPLKSHTNSRWSSGSQPACMTMLGKSRIPASRPHAQHTCDYPQEPSLYSV